MTLDPFLFPFPSPAYRRAARRALAGDFPQPELDALLDRAAGQRQSLSARRKPYAPGVTFVMLYFEWSWALYKVLQEEGWSAERAGSAIEAINWSIFEPASRLGFRISRLRSPGLGKRVTWILDLMFRTIFARPYRRVPVPSSKDSIAFDVVACPLAELYREQGVPELTRFAACSLDYRMAELWGVGFTRTTTIALGHPRCDFRFQVPRQQPPA